MKKSVSLILIFTMVSILFTACMDDSEKQKAKEKVEAAEPIVNEYIEENYSGAVVKNMKCATYSVPSVFGTTYASDYVKSTVKYNSEEFSVFTNISTGECYDNYYQDEITASVESKIRSLTDIEYPEHIEIKYAQKDIKEKVGDKSWFFAENSIKNIDDLLKDNKYALYVVCKYSDSKMDFENINAEQFFDNDELSDIELAFVNYRSAERYSDEDAVESDCHLYSLFDDADDFYRISEVKTICQIDRSSYDSETDERVTEVVFDEEYTHHETQTVHGVEFAWNDDYYSIEFSETQAEPVVTTNLYDGAEFYATDDIMVKLECEKITNQELPSNNYVYFFFDKSLYKSKVIENKDGENRVWTVDRKTNDYVYEDEYLKEDNHTITIGFYEMKK